MGQGGERHRSLNRSLDKALREYSRGIAGGLLFSLPLLYTMEVWWAGFTARPLHLLLYFLAGFLLLFGYNRYAGLHEDATWSDVAMEAVEEMGLGLVLAALALWLLGQIDVETTLREGVGKIVVEAVTAAIGISVGATQLGGNGKGSTDSQGMQEEEGPIGPIGQVAIAACGAVLFASNVAPTEEILLIAYESTGWRLVGLAVLSLVTGGVILSYSNFVGSDRMAPAGGIGSLLSRSTVSYAVALVVSALILLFFGRFEGASLPVCLAQTVVLGVAASLGASAGRLLLLE